MSLIKNIIFVPSVINVAPSIPSHIRSIYTKEQRFEQTKKTFKTIREKLPNYTILFIECSRIDPIQTEYLKKESDIFLNMIEDPEGEKYLSIINSTSKELGEKTMTIYAIEYLMNNSIKYDSFVKITSRYWLNNNFNTEFFHSNANIVNVLIRDNKIVDDFIYTCLYKLSYNTTIFWYLYLLDVDVKKYWCYEELFSVFINSIKDKITIQMIDKIGISGLNAPSGNVQDT